MIPCPGCRCPCGILDAMLIGDLLFYTCPRCERTFDADQARSGSPWQEEEDDDETPLVPPSPSILGQMGEDQEIEIEESLLFRRTPPKPPCSPPLARSLAPVATTSPPSALAGAVEGPPEPREDRRFGKHARTVVRTAAVIAAMGIIAGGIALDRTGVPQKVAKRQAANARASFAVATSNPPDPVPPPPPTAEVSVPTVSVPTVSIGELSDIHVTPPHPTAPPARLAAPPTQRTPSEQVTRHADKSFRAGDFASAKAMYQLALQANASYLPARIGAAHADWELGRREEARVAYRRIVDEAPSDLVPRLVRERAGER